MKDTRKNANQQQEILIVSLVLHTIESTSFRKEIQQCIRKRENGACPSSRRDSSVPTLILHATVEARRLVPSQLFPILAISSSQILVSSSISLFCRRRQKKNRERLPKSLGCLKSSQSGWPLDFQGHGGLQTSWFPWEMTWSRTIYTQPSSSCAMQGKLHNPSEPWRPYLYNADNGVCLRINVKLHGDQHTRKA